MTWKRCLGLAALWSLAQPLLAQGSGPVVDSGSTAWMLTSAAIQRIASSGWKSA